MKQRKPIQEQVDDLRDSFLATSISMGIAFGILISILIGG